MFSSFLRNIFVTCQNLFEGCHRCADESGTFCSLKMLLLLTSIGKYNCFMLLFILADCSLRCNCNRVTEWKLILPHITQTCSSVDENLVWSGLKVSQSVII